MGLTNHLLSGMILQVRCPPDGKTGKSSTQKCRSKGEMVVSRRAYHCHACSFISIRWSCFVRLWNLLVGSFGVSTAMMLSIRIVCHHQIMHYKIYSALTYCKFLKRVLTGSKGAPYFSTLRTSSKLGVLGPPSSHSFQKDSDYGWSTYLTYPPRK